MENKMYLLTGMMDLVSPGLFVHCSHPAFGLPGVAGSWGLFTVLSWSSPRMTRRCHRRLRGGKRETHPSIRSLTSIVASLSNSALPFDSPNVCGFFSSQWPHYLVFSCCGGGRLQPGSTELYLTLCHLIYALLQALNPLPHSLPPLKYFSGSFSTFSPN